MNVASSIYRRVDLLSKALHLISFEEDSRRVSLGFISLGFYSLLHLRWFITFFDSVLRD